MSGLLDAVADAIALADDRRMSAPIAAVEAVAAWHERRGYPSEAARLRAEVKPPKTQEVNPPEVWAEIPDDAPPYSTGWTDPLAEACTCGEEPGQRRHHDTSGWCERGEHQHCLVTLHDATGFHWFCACSCHPVPTHDDKAGRRAVDTFFAARARRGTP